MAISHSPRNLIMEYLRAKGAKTVIQRTDGRAEVLMSDGCSYVIFTEPDSLESLFEMHEYDHKLREVTG